MYIRNKLYYSVMSDYRDRLICCIFELIRIFQYLVKVIDTRSPQT